MSARWFLDDWVARGSGCGEPGERPVGLPSGWCHSTRLSPTKTVPEMAIRPGTRRPPGLPGAQSRPRRRRGGTSLGKNLGDRRRPATDRSGGCTWRSARTPPRRRPPTRAADHAATRPLRRSVSPTPGTKKTNETPSPTAGSSCSTPADEHADARLALASIDIVGFVLSHSPEPLRRARPQPRGRAAPDEQHWGWHGDPDFEQSPGGDAEELVAPRHGPRVPQGPQGRGLLLNIGSAAEATRSRSYEGCGRRVGSRAGRRT